MRRSLDSSAIAEIDYDEERSALDVRFRDGGTYRYFLVPRSVVDGLMTAPSAGRYFQERIRDRFSTVRLD